jgi:peptidoglycan/xylan/chitin deacetylase (PgdA/CDA1 family)
MTFAAVGAAVLVSGAPEPVRLRRPVLQQHKRRLLAVRRPQPEDPGFTGGRPIRELRRPVHTLHDLTPGAPPNAVALTIDDGPDQRWTPMMLDLLAEFGVPATFNLIGQQAKEFPELVRRIVAAGHQLADHTITHPLNLPSLSGNRMREEIGGAHDLIAQISGVAPRWFRAPGGAWSHRILDTATEHGMICIDWEVDPRDWARPGTRRIASTLLTAKAGDILLCHDGGGDRSETIQALRTVIPALKQRGLTFVAL